MWLTSATNIQDALNLATDGDTVIVSNGTYRIGPTVMVTNGIHLQSVNGWSNTVVMANGGQCMRILHSNAVVEGFAIEGGSVIGQNGGGVFMNCGVLRECEVRGNSALCDFDCFKWSLCFITPGSGGGVYAEGSAVIENCVIRENHSQHEGGGDLL